MNLRLQIAVYFAAAAVLVATASAQSSSAPLTLPDAVRIGLEKNPLRKAALADTRAASADIKAARSFLLPHLAFSETAMRGDDPVYVGGASTLLPFPKGKTSAPGASSSPENIAECEIPLCEVTP